MTVIIFDLLPRLDSMNSLFVTLREYGTVGYDERVGIWQEDAGTYSLVTFWRVESVTIPPTERFNSSILATIQGSFIFHFFSDRVRGGRKKLAVKLFQMLLV